MAEVDLFAIVERFLKYCELSKARSRHTILAYRQDLAEFTNYFSASKMRQSMKSHDVVDYVAFLKECRNLSHATIRRRIACLRSFFRWLEQSGDGISPFRGLDLSLERPKRLPRALSRQMVAEFTMAASAARSDNHSVAARSGAPRDVRDISRTTELAIRLMTATGVRVSELTAITIGDIAADGSAIRILGKGRRERTVFVGNQRLRDDVNCYASDRLVNATAAEPFLVNTRGRCLTPQSLRLRLGKISRNLRISHSVTPHRFRHTAATMLLEEGVDIRFVQRLLGHSSISTTEIYTHVTDTSLKAVIERADTIAKLDL